MVAAAAAAGPVLVLVRNRRGLDLVGAASWWHRRQVVACRVEQEGVSMEALEGGVVGVLRGGADCGCAQDYFT